MKMPVKFKIRSISSNLRAQLILFFTAFSLVIMAVEFYFTYIYMMNIIKKHNENYLLQQFRQSEYNIRSVMSETDRLLRLFTLDDSVEQFLQKNSHGNIIESAEIERAILDKIFDFIFNYYDYINSIYLFTENHAEIGRNHKYSIIIRDGQEEIKFFNSDIYRALKDTYPKCLWVGGYKEMFYNPHMMGGENFVISAAKEIRSTQDYTRKAILVFNINENYIASIYAATPDSKTNKMYIVDKSGKIISSSNGQNIGSLCTVSPLIKEHAGTQKDYGSFTYKKGEDPVQIVYYELEETGWYLVGEIPLVLFLGDIATLQKTLLIILLSGIFVIFAVSFFWLNKITEPLKVLAAKMYDMSSGKLGLTFSKIPKNELGIVIKRFNEMSLSIVELIKKNEEMQEEKRKLEIEALQSQINPHFIYNTLNMIKWMAMMKKPNDIVQSIVSLGNILRPAFKSMDKMCTLREEMDYITNYLKIMNFRFGNGISLEFNIPESAMEYKVPRFILQPVAENSIIHGMKRPGCSINICIEVVEEDNKLFILVSDTGEGIAEDKVKEINAYLSDMSKGVRTSCDGSIGLYNVNKRICLNFGNEFGIRLESQLGKGTRVTIKLPVIY